MGYTPGDIAPRAGNPGARLSHRLGIQSSSDTILRRVKIGSEAETPPVRVLGIDDWAWRRGHVACRSRGAPRN
jgi:hypothetical protein